METNILKKAKYTGLAALTLGLFWLTYNGLGNVGHSYELRSIEQKGGRPAAAERAKELKTMYDTPFREKFYFGFNNAVEKYLPK